jgi:hypothetical protein
VALGAGVIQERAGRRGTALVIALLPLMLSEWYVVGFPNGKPQPVAIPAIYRTREVRTARALVSLPSYRGTAEWFLEADYLYYSTLHWRPIVNGFGRAEPPDHAHVVSHMNAFPGPNNARTMRELGIEYVVVHTARYSDGAPELIRVASESPEYELAARVGPDYLFRVRAAR